MISSFKNEEKSDIYFKCSIDRDSYLVFEVDFDKYSLNEAEKIFANIKKETGCGCILTTDGIKFKGILQK